MTVVLVDSGSIFWRSYGATKSRQDAYTLSLDALEAWGRDYQDVILCCDAPTTWRHQRTAELAPELRYKGNRPPKDPGTIESLRDVEAQARSMGYQVVMCEGFEADDVVATLAAQAYLREVIIVSGDKDLHQMVSDSVCQVTSYGRVHPEDVERKFGVPPSLMRDLLALWGDDSDNVKGCPGIGQGKAARLLKTFGGLSALLEQKPEEILALRGFGSSTVESLMAWRDSGEAALATELVTLRTDCPIRLDDLLSDDEDDDDGVW